MRVPAFSSILHLFAAMGLLVDVLGALSHTTQTLHNNQRNATDRQLRAQDSRAKKKVIGDEERVYKFPFDLNKVPPLSPTRLIDIPPEFQLHPVVRGQQEATTSEVDSSFVDKMETILAETDKQTLKGLLKISALLGTI
ncbi:hypothetical protein Plhal304r1_c022g0077321 [Plasmopara halstedii]